MPTTFSMSADMGIAEAGLTAIFGYTVVFVGLVTLMAVISAVGAVFKAKAKKEAAAAAALAASSIAEETPASAPSAPTAPGSAGHIKLYDVPDKEAAMVMAVVAHKMQKPLNELRFISIKEVKNDEV